MDRIYRCLTVSADKKKAYQWYTEITHHFFGPKVPFLGLFRQKMEKISINHHLEIVKFYKPQEVYFRGYGNRFQKYLRNVTKVKVHFVVRSKYMSWFG